jgi:mycothiol synthase
MMLPDNDTLPFNLRDANPEEYAGLNELRNAMRLEIWPEDPPWPCSEEVHRLQTIPAIVQDAAWAIWDRSQPRILAFGETNIFHTGDNPRVLDVKIEVLPEFRRRGLGRELLRLIAAYARKEGRTLLMPECNDRVPAGAAFLERIGGRKGLDEPTNQLRLVDLDRSLVQHWMEREGDLSTEFALGFWDSQYPEDRLQDLAGLLQVVANDQPRDTLSLEDINYTPEFVRQFDNHQRAGGDERWSLYVSNRKDGHLAGISEVFWNPNRPSILWQGFTGVMPEYRNRGVGRWLKAAMLTKILRDRPQVKVIRTGNADSNAPMLKINHELGFQRYVAWAIWQVELDAVEKYLSAST